jgi:hypothetical protein
MRGVQVARRKHGLGMFKFSDDRGYYSGSWLRGMRHGMGVTIDMQGKFMGKFKKERRSGRGTMVYSNGDVIRGEYSCPKRRLRPSLLFGDEYCDGLLEGRAVLKFTDGSKFFLHLIYQRYYKQFIFIRTGRYEGDVTKSVPHGRGVYTDASGGRIEGNFVHGLLHGPGTRSVSDINQMGTFHHGELEGYGIVIDLTLGRMEGNFRRGVPHGHIVSQVNLIKGTYNGYYADGLRTGFGRLNFGNIDRDEKVKAQQLEKVFVIPGLSLNA